MVGLLHEALTAQFDIAKEWLLLGIPCTAKGRGFLVSGLLCSLEIRRDGLHCDHNGEGFERGRDHMFSVNPVSDKVSLVEKLTRQ